MNAITRTALERLTWTCHVCGDERPDDKISVAIHKHIDGNGIHYDENVRYCNDNPSCEKDARLHGHLARHAVKTEVIAMGFSRSAATWKQRFYGLAWAVFVTAVIVGSFAYAMSVDI